jgi:uncharacterized Fe-S cluster-containing protein
VTVDVLKLLPGYNCGRCGRPSCRAFAAHLREGGDVNECPLLSQERYAANRAELLEVVISEPAETFSGLVGGLSGDVLLAPLPGEPTCREDIYPFDRDIRAKAGDLVTYRPLGCPVVHYAKVLKVDHSVLTIHMTGPLNRLGAADYRPLDLGICMIAAFEGTVQNDRILEIGETVRFIPHQCMMQKVHAGVVVSSEGKKVRIEGIDLKVYG